jgi:4-methylaminobutanoate oxidase (formaldehyde-forming)
VREGVGMIDYTMLGKLMVEGRDAEAFLQRICTNNMALPVGRVAYTLMLNDRGGIESDVTVARHGPEAFMVMSSISHTRRDRDHLHRHIKPDEDVRLRDETSSFGVLSLAGPKSRELLAQVSDINLSNEAFPFNSLQHFHIGHAPVFAQRLSYTGELGWEIFVTPDFAEHVFEVLMDVGAPMGLQLVGGEALNALRIEKGFLHWGHDMAYADAPHQMGLEFTCKPDKPIPFIGRDANLARKEEGHGPFLASIKLRDPAPLLHHNEPVLRDDKIVGYVTSGAYAYTVGAAVGLCIVTADKAALSQGDWSVLVEGEKVAADLSLKPLFDPSAGRMRG